MKKYILFLVFISVINYSVKAFEYTEEDKNIFYDAFVEGYMQKMSETINSLDIEQAKKDKIIDEFAKQINKTDLINSSWNCIRKYPVNAIVQASVECTQDWRVKQSKINQELFKKIKEE